jgi:predicted nucleic acid-binding protein
MRPSLYLDTSVISAYYDEREAEKKAQTQDFWKKLGDYQVFISEITVRELAETQDVQRKEDLLALIEGFEVLGLTSSAEELADEYVKSLTIPEKYRDDALHLAIASVSGIDILVSWNFEHLVKRKTRLQANLINALQGYRTIDIIAPLEL